MKIFVDIEHKCHTTNPDDIFRELETNFFEGKCQTFIEGYCYEIRENAHVIYPWKPYSELASAQREYEKQKMNEYKESLLELGVEL